MSPVSAGELACLMKAKAGRTRQDRVSVITLGSVQRGDGSHTPAHHDHPLCMPSRHGSPWSTYMCSWPRTSATVWILPTKAFPLYTRSKGVALCTLSS